MRKCAAGNVEKTGNEKQGAEERLPLVDGKFLEIHRSKFELDLCGYCGQPSIGCITHCVFFFCVRKDAFNRLRAQRVGCFAQR